MPIIVDIGDAEARLSQLVTRAEAAEDVIIVRDNRPARVRYEVAGGNYRLIVAFDFRRQIAFVKFIGTHAEYDAIDPLTVSQY
jgi:mRNA-degrading endonuclease HigB of HigAB toxin-antitoxin module